MTTVVMTLPHGASARAFASNLRPFVAFNSSEGEPHD